MYLLDDQTADLKIIFISLLELISSIYKDEFVFWTELKFEVHLNSLLAQLVELCSQLPENEFSEVIETVRNQSHVADISIFKSALVNLENRSITGEDA